MEEMTYTELENMLLNNRGVSFISIKSVTKQSTLNKGGRKGVPAMMESIDVNPDLIKKHAYLTALISGGKVSYQDFVNNRLVKEADSKGTDNPIIVRNYEFVSLRELTIGKKTYKIVHPE